VNPDSAFYYLKKRESPSTTIKIILITVQTKEMSSRLDGCLGYPRIIKNGELRIKDCIL